MTGMMRALGILAALMVCLAPARAERLRIDLAGVDLDVEGTWSRADDVDGWEYWLLLVDDEPRAQVAFYKKSSAYRCEGGDSIEQIQGYAPSTYAYVFDTVEDLGVGDGMHDYRGCFVHEGTGYNVMFAVFEGESLTDPHLEPLADMARRFVAAVKGITYTPDEPDEPDEPFQLPIHEIEEDPEEEPTQIADADVSGAAEPPAPEQPRRPSALRFVRPQTVHAGAVRWADDMGSGWGAGLVIAKPTWQEHRRKAIGYELSGAIAKDWWQVGALLRPGISPHLREAAASLYLALGVDGTADVDVAPVGGAGADLLLEGPIGMFDLAAQVLADPGGLHAWSLRGGLGLGDDMGMVRLGVTYTGFGGEGSALLLSLGFTRLRER